MVNVLDLFSGGGGAARGYADRPGFVVRGVDTADQPNYPFEFFRATWQDGLSRWADWADLIHASPVCKRYCLVQHSNGKADDHPDQIADVRAALRAAGKPFVIENVVGAPLVDPIVLCGEMFGLGVIRHRLFESSFPLPQPSHPRHRGYVRGWRHGVYREGPYVAVHGKGGGKATLTEASAAMGIDWMDLDEITQAIPPAYTRWIARYV